MYIDFCVEWASIAIDIHLIKQVTFGLWYKKTIRSVFFETIDIGIRLWKNIVNILVYHPIRKHTVVFFFLIQAIDFFVKKKHRRWIYPVCQKILYISSCDLCSTESITIDTNMYWTNTKDLYWMRQTQVQLFCVESKGCHYWNLVNK